MNKYTIGSFFAGVGGIDLGFEQAEGFTVTYANEIDPYPVVTYEANFPIKVDCRSIEEVKGAEIPNFDIMAGGFPCQAFSVAGYRQGFDDEKGRGTLFFELTRIIKEKKETGNQPSIVFFENVKNLVGHDGGNTFKVIKEELESLGYHVKAQVLNAAEYGNTPQNRERIYIVGFLDEEAYKNFAFPLPTPLVTTVEDVVDFENKVDDKFYYTPEKHKFYKELSEGIANNKSVYQWRRKYVRENKSGVCPTLTANMGTGGHNVPIVSTAEGIRKLTPRECFSFQGFPSTFELPNELSNTRLYKQAGNSVAVPVVERIARNIFAALHCQKL